MTLGRYMESWLSALAYVPVIIAAILLPLTVWWMLEPSPIEVTYVAPHFVDRPVTSRDEAAGHAVFATTGGRELYRYVEYCVRRPFTGTIRRSWVNTAMVWHAPDLPTQLSRNVGCHVSNVVVETPTSSPARSFMFVQKLVIDVNPLRQNEEVEYPPIPLMILPPK